METSTFGLKEEKNKLSIKVKENNIQLRADVIQTVTEIINVVDDENSNYTNSQENTVTEESEAKVTDNKHQYEVSEAISDITTPHVLLLKNTNNKEVETTPHDIIQPGGDDEAHLRVIPLQENDNSKLDQTITEDESFNSLGNELNRLNNVEEESVLEKFRHHLNDLNDDEEEPASTEAITKSIKKNTYSDKKELYEKKSKSDKQFDKPISDEEPVSQKEVDNVKPVTEGFILNGFSRCAIGQFQCVNGTSIRDDTWQCNFDEFQCETKGRCIPLSWKCDGRTQCPQGNDEHNCHNSFCKNNEFQCVQQDTCVPLSWRCDGKSDCTNDEDEKLCGKLTFAYMYNYYWYCGIDQFKCAIGGGCISQEYVCDGIEQCADRSDEWNCMKIDQLTSNSSDTNENNTNKYLMIQNKNNTWYPICYDSWNSTYSDMACSNLGYSTAYSTEELDIPEDYNSTLYHLKSNRRYSINLLSQLEAGNEKCDKIISLTCNELACDSNLLPPIQEVNSSTNTTEIHWPNMGLLLNKKRNIQCTATLLASSWAIASYSCIAETVGRSVSPQDWVLYAGSLHLFGSDNSSTQMRYVKEIIVHPQTKYNRFEFDNDIVLIRLISPMMLGENVSAICLPRTTINTRQVCVTAGWSFNKPQDLNIFLTETSAQRHLRHITVPIIDQEQCNSTAHFNGHVTKEKLCTGHPGSEETHCYNDAGAPLMCYSKDTSSWQLYGILSYSNSCGRSSHPSVYTSISPKITKWITNTIGPRLLQKES
ncbi:transmembrane protease serine [Holotrichia oblita]|uniref:Transmembrane protease serine n=1 Tax=Holotrichia oblita TaxID=644536 RepID=A0ACB9TGH5_HOLOL|nr:transmembrane protease serine [Holotrichia oblita]